MYPESSLACVAAQEYVAEDDQQQAGHNPAMGRILHNDRREERLSSNRGMHSDKSFCKRAAFLLQEMEEKALLWNETG